MGFNLPSLLMLPWEWSCGMGKINLYKRALPIIME